MDRRTFVKYGTAGLASSALGCFAYAVGVEPHWLEIVTRDLAIEHLPANLEGMRLAQVSDLHIGPKVSDDYIIRTFDRLRSLAPEIVVVTGDFVTYRVDRGEAQFEQLRSVLSHFPHGSLATTAILGNHDYGRLWREPAVADRVAAEAERAGIRVLRNQTHTVAGLDIIGIDDLWGGRADSVAALGGRVSDSAIVLLHNPDGADQLRWPGYRGWILAGHTHGGQCKPPFLPPPLLPVVNRRYVSGEVSVSGDASRTLYISRGVGHLLHARFNVRPEVTLFTLRRRARG